MKYDEEPEKTYALPKIIIEEDVDGGILTWEKQIDIEMTQDESEISSENEDFKEDEPTTSTATILPKKRRQ